MSGRSLLAALLLTLGGAGPARTQTGGAAGLDSVTVVADSSFVRGGFHRLLLGQHYRDLWATPLRVAVLDLGAFAGGLTPVRRGGGNQTASLRLLGADGKQYVFRSLRKNAEVLLPPALRQTFVRGVLADQMSGLHPGGALVVPPILEAAGVLHATPELRVMPDDARLGAFRAEFGGRLGTIEERPAEVEDDGPGFAGSRDIRGTDALIERLRRRPWVRVNSRAFLTARLLDLFLGDWDRHEDQWRWALIEGEELGTWEPIPRDRDAAFSRYDGLVLGVARWVMPYLLKFDASYDRPAAATWTARWLDRRLLAELEWPVWDSIATALQARITDTALADGLARLPPEYRAADGPELGPALRARRDGLHEAARRYYLLLAEHVTLEGGDGNDVAEVLRHPDGETEVRLSRAGRTTPYYWRRFHSRETREIRLYLRGGDDRAVVTGPGSGPLVRIVAGEGRDTLRDESRRRQTRFYDVDPHTVALGAPMDRRPYRMASDTSAAAYPDQDWGVAVLPAPRVEVSQDVGLAVGAGVSWRTFGFRRQPYATSSRVSLEYSFGRNDYRARLDTRRKAVNRDRYLTAGAMASGLEGLRFHGFGNGSLNDQPEEFYLVRQRAYELSTGLGWGLEGRAQAQLLARARHTVTDPDNRTNANGFIGQTRPLGFGDFGQLGLVARLEWDSRDHPQGPRRGLHAALEGAVYPVTWSEGEGAFGSLGAQVSTFLTPGQAGPLTVVLRAGARQVWGDFPYFEASYLGGKQTLRGYLLERFAGDGAVFGTAEARLWLTRAFVIIPGELGIFGLADAGRVFSDFDTDDGFHTDGGGGLFYGMLDRALVLSLGAAQGDEGLRFYLGFGMGF